MVEISRWHELTERIWQAIAWRLPRRLVYWATIRTWSAATTGEWSDESPEMTVVEALDRWEGRPAVVNKLGCPDCGGPISFVECHNANCENGYVTDLYELEPDAHDPGDFELCTDCHGGGGDYWCLACQKRIPRP